MSKDGAFVYATQSTGSNQQLATVMMELSQHSVSVHHIDEMFFWLARMISSHLDVAVVEFWTRQASSTGEFSLDLRAMVCQDDAVPERLVINNTVRSIIEDIQNERRGFWLKPVADLFNAYQANLLGRYGLGYCSSYLLKSAALLPPQRGNTSAGKIATPLVLSVLLFLEHPPSQRLLLGIGHILERALVVAKKQGLLLTSEDAELAVTFPSDISLQQQPRLSLSDLIPKYVQEPHDGKVDDSFMNPAELPNKQVRRLYAAIDGHMSVRELILLTQLSMEEIRASLRILLLRHRIQLYEPDGLPVDSTRYLNGAL